MRWMILAAVLLGSAPAAAADACDQLCQMAEGECRRECKNDVACVSNCRESRVQCPALCRAMVEAKGNKEKLKRDADMILDRADRAKAAPAGGKQVKP